jgi:hypothetical protein
MKGERTVENEKWLIAEALKKYHDSKFTPGVYEHSIFGKAAMLLEEDAVEVVRCKDCKYYLRDEMFGGGYCDGERVKKDHFCSYGERKDNG